MTTSFLSRFFTISAFILLFQSDLLCQGSAGSAAVFESRSVIDMPTAGVLTPSYFALATRVAPNGDFTGDMAIAPFTNMNIRLFATGQNLISNEAVQFNVPTLQTQFRFIDETRSFPALAFGITSKTNGYFSQDFLFNQSVGGWVSASKNFNGLIGAIALHGGVFASVHSFGGYAGFEQSVGNSIAIVGEATIASKDNANKQKEIYGLCNASFRWSVVRGITLELIAHDLFSTVNSPGIGRAFGIEFIRAW
ncbi:MAG: hypothetical protein HYZ54_13020 [Ignavibacteriae bacterium]|nr:hypothetical protein [Ignavibacteriota bacterium]